LGFYEYGGKDLMAKLTDFPWQSFLGHLTPATVARLGEKWGIDEWTKALEKRRKPEKQDVKVWVGALAAISPKKLGELVDLADQIKTVGIPEGRQELAHSCPEHWIDQHANTPDLELSALAFLEHNEGFRQALGWVEVLLKDRWECYQAKSNQNMNVGSREIRDLQKAVGDYWTDQKLGGRCMVTAMHRKPVTVIEIGYEEGPEGVREFAEKGGESKTELTIINPLRDALLRYDSSTGVLKTRIYRGNVTRCDDLVRRAAEVCFGDADFFPIGTKRSARYNLSVFSTRPAFLADIDGSSGLESVIVTKLTFEPPYFFGSRLRIECPPKQARSSGKDAYDVLGGRIDTSNWKVIHVEMKAYFESGRRKELHIELKAKGGASSAGDPKYEIIEKHLRHWGVLK
jgi:hypothetical protein